nr:hypothetical protein [Tanacetum cinerariifolium]
MIERNFVEIQGAFFVKIRDNTFNGIIGENAFEHNNKFLKVVGPIKINGVTQDRFRLSIFPISLTEIEAKEDDEPDDIIDIFKIKGNLFDYETPLCKAFNDFNYLFKIDMDLFTFDIQVMRTYEEYELNNTMTKDLEEPWLDKGVPYQLCDHICEPYHFKNEITKRPMYSLDIDGFSNGGELPGMVRVKSMTYFQDHKWDDPTHEPSVCKIRRFKMRNYSFNADEEYIIIKESEYVNHSKDNLEAYQELLRIIDEGWVVAILKDKLIKSGKEKVKLNNWLKQKCFPRDNLEPYSVSLGLGYDVLTSCTDLAIRK